MTKITTTQTAVEAVKRGFQPIPLITGDKRPALPAWTRVNWKDATPEKVAEDFEKWADDGKGNIGVLLGEPSGGLVDVDIDHPKASRLKDYFLPHTAMVSGRPGRPASHFWYVCEDGTMPGTRQHLMPRENGKKGAVSIELRSSLAQTVLPPSIHPTGEQYRWEGEPWGGEEGPALVNGRVLSAQVALIGLGAVLLDNWPHRGTRHEAYLALAGGLLSYGDMGVHPFWERNAAVLIRALADATLDDDGPEAREREVIGTTIRLLRNGERAVGLGKLAEILGDEHVRQARVMIAEVESAAGFVSRQAPAIEISDTPEATPSSGIGAGADEAHLSEIAAKPLEDRDPLEERLSTWSPVDLGPYLSGQVKPVLPSVLLRDDGQALMYPGRVNMLYGSSESAKSWIALQLSLQVMSQGERVVYLDFEDEPVNTLERLKALGAGHDDVQKQFAYIRPEDPIAAMQRDRWGKTTATDRGLDNEERFQKTLSDIDPTLIVADGMSVIYGLHGLNTNDTVETDVITSWLKRLTRNGRTTVVVIDHTSKGADKGALPIGSQHKTAMVQGTLLQAWPIMQPMPGAVGKIELVVLKDRPGEVRRVSESSGGQKAQVCAVVTMDSTTEGVTQMTLAAPFDPTKGYATDFEADLRRSREAELAMRREEDEEKVKHLYRGELGRGMGMSELRNLLEGWSEGRIRRTMERLEAKGWIIFDGEKRGRRYILGVGGAGYDEYTGEAEDVDIDIEILEDNS